MNQPNIYDGLPLFDLVFDKSELIVSDVSIGALEA
jgi:hypothetical protein